MILEVIIHDNGINFSILGWFLLVNISIKLAPGNIIVEVPLFLKMSLLQLDIASLKKAAGVWIVVIID